MKNVCKFQHQSVCFASHCAVLQFLKSYNLASFQLYPCECDGSGGIRFAITQRSSRNGFCLAARFLYVFFCSTRRERKSSRGHSRNDQHCSWCNFNFYCWNSLGDSRCDRWRLCLDEGAKTGSSWHSDRNYRIHHGAPDPFVLLSTRDADSARFGWNNLWKVSSTSQLGTRLSFLAW